MPEIIIRAYHVESEPVRARTRRRVPISALPYGRGGREEWRIWLAGFAWGAWIACAAAIALCALIWDLRR